MSSTCPHNMVNFGPLTAEIVSLVWGTPGNFNGFRVLAALLHGTLVVGVSQTLRRWTGGATYIQHGGHHVGHWPKFLVITIIGLCYINTCKQLKQVHKYEVYLSKQRQQCTKNWYRPWSFQSQLLEYSMMPCHIPGINEQNNAGFIAYHCSCNCTSVDTINTH